MSHNAGLLQVRLVSHQMQSFKDKNDKRNASDLPSPHWLALL